MGVRPAGERCAPAAGGPQGLELTRPDSVASPADAFVTARLDPGGRPGDSHRTRVCRGSRHPTFNEHFALFCSAPNAALHLAAYHHDPGAQRNWQ